MSVKFRIGLTIDGETLFGLMAKMLPIENLSVEEIAPRQPKLPIEAIAHAVKPITKRQKQKRASPGPNLKKGINEVIVVALADGPLRAVDLQSKAVAAGFSANSVNSRLEFLRNKDVVERMGNGRWRLMTTTKS